MALPRESNYVCLCTIFDAHYKSLVMCCITFKAVMSQKHNTYITLLSLIYIQVS